MTHKGTHITEQMFEYQKGLLWVALKDSYTTLIHSFLRFVIVSPIPNAHGGMERCKHGGHHLSMIKVQEIGDGSLCLGTRQCTKMDL